MFGFYVTLCFFLLFPLLLFVMFGLKKKKKTEKWERGVNCIREKKNEMSEGRCMCVVGEKKKERKKMRWVRGDVYL
jgi:hypothetical protein